MFGDNSSNELDRYIGVGFEFILDKVMYNKDSFTIARVIPTSSEVNDIINPNWGTLSIKGNMPNLVYAIKYKCEIINVEQNKYGYTCDVVGVAPNNMSVDNMKTDEDMVNFLDIFVGEGVAKKCSDVKGICKIIKDKDFQKLTSIKGIGVATAEKIINAYEENIENGVYITKLRKMGFTHNEIKKMADGLGSGELAIALDIVKRNVYDTVYRFNLRLDRVDNIALNSLGIDNKDKRRIEAYIYKSLDNELSETNSSYITLEQFYDNDIMKNLESNVGFELVEDSLKSLEKNRIVKILDNKIIGMNFIYNCEKGIIREVNRLAHNDKKLISDKINITKAIQEQEERLNITLNEGQKEAIKSILSNGFSMLTAKAGCGKTFITNIVMNILEDYYGYVDYSLCCFAGKGADNLSSGCGGRIAGTIHRTLGFSGCEFMHDEENKIGSDIVIVDEVGMISSSLIYSLLKAIKDDAIVIFLGDSAQLASLSNGVIIRDIPKISNEVNLITLTDVVRQAKESGILSMANEVSDGINSFSRNDATYGELKDFDVKIGDYYEELIEDFVDNFDIENREDSFVVCSTNKMATKLNRDIQAKLIERGYLNKEKYITISTDKDGYETRIHENDVVMVVSNNYSVINVNTLEEDYMFNGNIGIVTEINTNDKVFILKIKDKSLLIDKDKFDCIRLGLVATCNKMQGSTIQRGYIYLEDNWVNKFLLGSRNWLYTALTRFKKSLKLYVGGYDVLSKMISKEATDGKRTFIEYIYE